MQEVKLKKVGSETNLLTAAVLSPMGFNPYWYAP
uniref:Uncharacterized protein n=1 Tax=Pyricularia oryzae (strain 70-15 / ATCC MYA-4617 / FGSC 8958) TaxID=242507 RepID=G5EI64_PYRO7|nr:hypothetical protein MGCH7_ch7g95 [Pyricularia oryzae 70-15]EAQ70691.1 hypothetical protein MGCH7_ch7g98 [Pyricularia oryzae 70-15]